MSPRTSTASENDAFRRLSAAPRTRTAGWVELRHAVGEQRVEPG